jgi:hypothetical protein
VNTTYYNNTSASSGIPSAGNICYTTSAGTTFLGSGYYRTTTGYIYISGSSGVVSSTGSCFCMVEGTLVTLSDGTTATIESLITGDTLSSLSIETIPDTYVDCDGCIDDLLAWETSVLTTTDGEATVLTNEEAEVNIIVDINNGLLKSTPDHVHFIKRNDLWQFEKAINIVQGDILMDISDEEVLVSTTEILENGTYKVYKLNVEVNDVFYANGILTHNGK